MNIANKTEGRQKKNAIVPVFAKKGRRTGNVAAHMMAAFLSAE